MLKIQIKILNKYFQVIAMKYSSSHLFRFQMLGSEFFLCVPNIVLLLILKFKSDV